MVSPRPREKLAPGVLRLATDRGWRVSVGTREHPLCASYADRAHGGRRAALAMANATAKLFHKELGLPFVNRSMPIDKRGGPSGVRGVSAVDGGWMVTIYPEPGKRVRHFVHRTKGFRAAVTLRQQLLRKVYHVPRGVQIKQGRILVRAVDPVAARAKARAKASGTD